MQAEHLERAFGLLDEMRSCGVEADCTTWGTLMNLCAEAKQGHRADQLLQVYPPACFKVLLSACFCEYGLACLCTC